MRGFATPFTYTHKVATFEELRNVLGTRLNRGFSIGDGKGEFRLDFDPTLGFSARAEGDRGMEALRIVEGLLNHKRRWFAPFLLIPAWKYIALYATLETTATFLGERAGLPRIAMVIAIWWFVILVQPEWSAGQLSQLLLVRPHERTLLQDVTWKILVPLFVGGTLLALRGCAAAAGIM